ncbi:MAG TPA: hypothetical protein VFJ30_00225 [Phycisphaerae bacterium]|nr:hypothetical protein [Phycisphaerae bacterium]
MPLVRVNLPDALPPVPPEVASFIADAQSRIESFVEAHRDKPIPSFVPSEFPLVYAALRCVAEGHLAAGPVFCEWGSGAGVVACLAAMVGFDAHGIEFEGELADLSVQLARDHGIEVDFRRGNIVPYEGQEIAAEVEEFQWLAVGGPDPYDRMGLEIDDFDVIFAFPWPGEQRVIERLFDRFAADGALLMTYDAVEGVRLVRRRSA